MTTPTNNPIPSESPKDLAFNAGKIDEFVNSPEEAFSDRFGLSRLTITGIQAEADGVIGALGFAPVDSFEAGATITSRNQSLHYLADNNYYRWDGSLPKVVAAASTPSSSGGVTSGAWVNVTDNTLRSQLASGTIGNGSDLVKYKSTATGSVPRNVSSKLSDSVTVEDFGAVGDGVTDDTIAIQSALNSGASVVTNTCKAKKYYRITDTLQITTDNQTFNLNRSEMNLDTSTATKSHILCEKSVQMNAPCIEKIVFTNSNTSSVYQVDARNIGGIVIQDCVFYGASKAFGGVDVTRAIVGYIRRNLFEGLVDTGIRLKGTGSGANRAVDIAVYDNRFVGGKHAVRYGDWYEGLFFRRNICYAQSEYQLVIEPSSAAVSLLSGKIQDNDFDSPQTTNGGIYVQYYKNLQINGNWFANNSTDPMIRLESTNTVIIQGNQAYPASTWVSDNGINTSISGNIASGGITHVLYGTLADSSSVMANHFTGSSAFPVNANAHSNKLDVIGNHLQGSSGGIAVSASVAGHNFLNNTGDTVVGTGLSVTLGASPATYTTGARPEILGFKGGSITNISVNTNQMATSSNVTIGPIPPHSTVVVTYTGATPGLQSIKVL